MIRVLACLAGLALAHAGVASASPLVAAAESGDGAAAAALIAGGADVNARSADGTTALHWAVHHDDVELVERLVAAGADVAATNQFGSSPMAEAAVVGNVEVLKALLKGGADVESVNAEGQTALMVVARSGNLDAARLLLRHGARVNAAEQWQGQTALMWASAQSRPDMVKLLVGEGASVDARSLVREWPRQVSAERRAQWRPVGGMTPLLYAARQGCLPCVRELLAGRADVNLQSPEGVTPLLMAVMNLHFDVAAELVSAGADVDRWDWRGRSPLYAAIDLNTLPAGGRPDRPALDATSSLELARKLLAAGANPNLQLKTAPPHRHLPEDRGADGLLGIGATPLLRAAKAHDVDAIRLLLEYGANIELPTDTGVTPLAAAAGLNSTTRDTRGQYLGAGVQPEVIESLGLLLDAGARINAPNAAGHTALHAATLWGWEQVVGFLLEKGADPHARDAQGFTALDAAEGRLTGGRGRGGGLDGLDAETSTRIAALLSAGTHPR